MEGFQMKQSLTWMKRLFKSDTDGSALVEMAVTLPLMMFLITGLCFMGIAVDNYIILSHANDVGARYLALNRGQLTDPCAQTVTVMQNAAPGLNTANLSYAFKIGSSGTLGSSCTSATANMVAASTATVSVSYTYPLIIYGWGRTNLKMQAVTSEVIQ
jgi:Flp pilus assembly protein TadG